MDVRSRYRIKSAKITDLKKKTEHRNLLMKMRTLQVRAAWYWKQRHCNIFIRPGWKLLSHFTYLLDTMHLQRGFLTLSLSIPTKIWQCKQSLHVFGIKFNVTQVMTDILPRLWLWIILGGLVLVRATQVENFYSFSQHSSSLECCWSDLEEGTQP